MADLQLWRVRVTRTQETTGEAMVWAESRNQAMQMGRDEVDLDCVINGVDYTNVTSHPADFTELDAIKPGNEWLVLPDGTSTDDVDEFRAVLTPEMRFVLQQREWERNGQLTMGVEA
jgi:hypothetical protein